MAATLIHKDETLVYSTRWFDDDEVAQRGQSDRTNAAQKIAVQIVIRDQEHDERLAALSQRPTLFNFLKSDVRSHAFA